MLEWITDTIESAGYAGIALLMIVENVFPPIPSELIMPLAGFLTVQGELSFPGVVIAGTFGSVVGNFALYYVGKKIGPERLNRWADRHGWWLMLSREDIERARGWFDRHGTATVFLSRLVPGIRSLISIPAGIEGMNPAFFALLSACGTGLWAGTLAYLGRILGQNFKNVSTYIGPIGYVVIGGLLTWYLVHVIREWRKRNPG